MLRCMLFGDLSKLREIFKTKNSGEGEMKGDCLAVGECKQ